jgi:prevent-host-death family protein
MSHEWQLQDAKNRFSEVVEKACDKGPQTVTKHGRPTVVVLSVKDYRRLRRKGSGLVDFLRQSPLNGVDLALKRRRDLSRKVDL